MIARAGLAVLFLIAPFEPRYTLPLGVFQISLLEAVALPCFAVFAYASRRRPWRLAPPLVALGLLVTAAVLSASLAEADPGRSLKFALRLAAMTAFAVLVARLAEDEIRWGFTALAFSGSVAALLAVAEGLGARSLDVFLGVFREIPFNVAGVRRASAGSEYPNLGAAVIVYALAAAASLLREKPLFRALVVAGLTAGLAFTYSRGAWLAGLVALLVTAWFERGRGRLFPSAVYVVGLGIFVSGQEISRIRLGGENANDFYSATYLTRDRFELAPAERLVTPVTVRNIGRRPWRRAEEIHLSYHLYQDAGRPLVDGPRTRLPRDVLPGESATLQAELRAPSAPGDYLLMWDLVHEHTTWFSGQGVKPGFARLSVGFPASKDPPRPSETAALLAIPDSLGWRPSRMELWSIAARMWAENPFLGVGPDNFRWLYGVRAGKAVFDTRVFANNTFLELAATLGTLGLASFGAAVFFAFKAGARDAAASATPCSALAILAAMVVHGLADYLLAFTGHYLVFGLAVGALSRSYGEIESR
jgi:hypothetical protein